jgi:hypothetical protein
MHVHTVKIPSGPELVSSAAPDDTSHVHTFVTQIGTAERIHVTSPPAGAAGMAHHHRVSLPVPMNRQIWSTFDTGAGIPVGQHPVHGPGMSQASAWRYQNRFPGAGYETAAGFLGIPSRVGFRVGPLRFNVGLSEGEMTAAAGPVMPLLVGLGLVGLAVFVMGR